ncbi:hypothetical protein [Hydrogenobacter thermophilus]|nr:hypothetical protein [Hydrogenobacter thermophilus]
MKPFHGRYFIIRIKLSNRMEVLGYKISKHLERYLSGIRSFIKTEWIARVILEPEFVEEVSEEEVRLWKKIPEFGNRFLRVVVNPKDKIIITAFF